MEHAPRNTKERLPTIEVANRIVWVNDKLQMPFDLRLGEQSKLGVLLALDEKGAGFPGMPRDYHWRSLDLGKVYFEDTDHRIYRDVDMKGTGLLGGDLNLAQMTEPAQWYATKRKGEPVSMNVRGLLNKTDALRDAIFAEEFTALGIRTHRAVAIIELDEVNVGSERLLVSEAHRDQLLNPQFTPVVEIRAFGTKTRVGDLYTIGRTPRMKFSGAEYLKVLRERPLSEFISVSNQERVKAEIAETLQYLSTEQGRTFSQEEYVAWFVGQTARNTGKLHNAGYVHQYLHAQNVTLDGRLTDFDDIYRLEDKEQPHLSEREVESEQEDLLSDDINFDPHGLSNRPDGSLLDWLEPHMVMLQKLYPEELSAFDTSRTNELFFENYLRELTNPTIRRLVEHCIEQNTPPKENEG